MDHPNPVIVAFLAFITSWFFFLGYKSVVDFDGALKQTIYFLLTFVWLGSTIFYFYKPSILMDDDNKKALDNNVTIEKFQPNETAIFTFTGDTVLIQQMTIGTQAVGGPFWQVMYKDNLGKLNLAEIPESKIKKINP